LIYYVATEDPAVDLKLTAKSGGKKKVKRGRRGGERGDEKREKEGR
jgi:hypothetical protein